MEKNTAATASLQTEMNQLKVDKSAQQQLASISNTLDETPKELSLQKKLSLQNKNNKQIYERAVSTNAVTDMLNKL